jgi:hypothetical protein
MAFKVRVTVRDGRAGREGGRAGVTPSGKGAILRTFEADFPPELDEGDVMELPDGSMGMVTGSEDRINPADQSFEHTIYVGNLPLP